MSVGPTTLACGLLTIAVQAARGQEHMEPIAKLFWLTTVVAVPLAFLPQPGLVRWAAISWLALIGVMCALGNWVMIAACITRRRSGSMIPLLGTLFLGATVAAVPATVVGRWITWGLFLEPWPCAIGLWAIGCMFKRRTR